MTDYEQQVLANELAKKMYTLLGENLNEKDFPIEIKGSIVFRSLTLLTVNVMISLITKESMKPQLRVIISDMKEMVNNYLEEFTTQAIQ